MVTLTEGQLGAEEVEGRRGSTNHTGHAATGLEISMNSRGFSAQRLCVYSQAVHMFRTVSEQPSGPAART